MPITIEPLTEATLPAVEDMLMRLWGRDWKPEFSSRLFRWRFLDRKNGEAILVMDGTRCVAMIDSWVRQYMINGELVSVRELCDWFSLPEYGGVGLKPMRMMMKKAEPIVSIGGSQATQSLLPKLGWKPLPHPAVDYSLPVTGGAIVERFFKRFNLPGKQTCVRLANGISLPHRSPDIHIESEREPAFREHSSNSPLLTVSPPRGSYQLASLIGTNEIDWICSAPEEMGEFIALEFLLDNQVIGLTLSRLFSGEHTRKANIVQVQSSQVSTDIYRWMINETTSLVASKGADVVKCRTTCAFIAEALHQLGYLKRDSWQTVWWSKNQEPPQGPILLSRYRADDAIQPYPK
jgi:hypothetical protein